MGLPCQASEGYPKDSDLFYLAGDGYCNITPDKKRKRGNHGCSFCRNKRTSRWLRCYQFPDLDSALKYAGIRAGSTEFTDDSYPDRMKQRVHWTANQSLQNFGNILPRSSKNIANPLSLDLDLLNCYNETITVT